jgi:tetratricopeptide (TPR) repeat protein
MPNSAHLWNSLGTTVGALNRLTDAIACFERALSIDPKSRDGHYYLALALYTAGQREEALSRLAAGFAAVSDFPQGRELEATIRREQAGGS